MIRQKTCNSLAPSTRDASKSSFGIPLYDADKITIQKPTHIHTPAKISAKLFTVLLISHPTGSKLKVLLKTAFKIPI
ncbi:unnamed protein product [marine sediment metagenome]|uniref:Uncharacterized protein n=1 Tax=marine sediment metagenome TaxID=412755 RepID=X1BPR8_9ZZZZ